MTDSVMSSSVAVVKSAGYFPSGFVLADPLKGAWWSAYTRNPN